MFFIWGPKATPLVKDNHTWEWSEQPVFPQEQVKDNTLQQILEALQRIEKLLKEQK